MSDPDRDALALDWVRRIYDPSFAEWDEHLAWLEADPANAAAFDAATLRIEALTAGLAPARTPPAAVNDNRALVARRWLVGTMMGGLAAAMVAAIVLPNTLGQTGVVVRTAAGERRMVSLADGTRIALNGDSRLSYADAGARQVSLEQGEAFFSVVHDASRPFEVHTGGTVVRDVGTAFNLASDGGRLEVAVSEGSVDVERSGQIVHLPAGRGVAVTDADFRESIVAPRDVGSWREGRLAYSDVPLGRVARDLRRATGMPVRVAAPFDARRFTGVLIVDPDRRAMIARFAAVTGLAATHDTQGWTLRAPRR